MAPLGYGLVRLRDLDCGQDQFSKSHFRNEANVRRLERVFQLEGCNRFEPSNWVQVAIDRTRWQGIASNSSLSAQTESPKSSIDWQLLDLSEKLQVLHGRHRLLAAQRFFKTSSKRELFWTVEFLESQTVSEAWKLRLDDKNNQLWSNGEIYRLMRLDYLDGNEDRARQLQARIRGPKIAESIKKLLFCEKYRSILRSLDSLLSFAGLWSDFQPGSIHHLLNLRTPEALESYIGHILTIWTTIVGDDLRPQDLDRQTVVALEGFLPYRQEDAADLQLTLEGHHVFSGLPSETRNAIIVRIKGLSSTILSLGTFCRDYRWIEPPLKILRVYLEQRHGPSIMRAYSQFYTLPKVSEKEVSAGQWQIQPFSLSVEETEDLAFLQLYAFCWRNFPFLSSFMPKNIRKGTSLSDKDRGTYDKLHEIATRLGYILPSNDHPSVQKAIRLNLQNCFRDEGSCTELSNTLARKRRHGLPDSGVFETARRQLFLDDIFLSTRNDFCLAFEITRNIFKAFFAPFASSGPSFSHTFASRSLPAIVVEEPGGKRKRPDLDQSVADERPSRILKTRELEPEDLKSQESELADPPISPTSIYSRVDDDIERASPAQVLKSTAIGSMPWFTTELVSEHDIAYYDTDVRDRIKRVFGHINHGIEHRDHDWWQEITTAKLGTAIILEPSANLICFIEPEKATAYLRSTEERGPVGEGTKTFIHTLSRGRILPVPMVAQAANALYVISQGVSSLTMATLRQLLRDRFGELAADL